jgi:hypothetical protein
MQPLFCVLSHACKLQILDREASRCWPQTGRLDPVDRPTVVVATVRVSATNRRWGEFFSREQPQQSMAGGRNATQRGLKNRADAGSNGIFDESGLGYPTL